MRGEAGASRWMPALGTATAECGCCSMRVARQVVGAGMVAEPLDQPGPTQATPAGAIARAGEALQPPGRRCSQSPPVCPPLTTGGALQDVRRSTIPFNHLTAYPSIARHPDAEGPASGSLDLHQADGANGSRARLPELWCGPQPLPGGAQTRTVPGPGRPHIRTWQGFVPNPLRRRRPSLRSAFSRATRLRPTRWPLRAIWPWTRGAR